jgi:hypothetical protein
MILVTAVGVPASSTRAVNPSIEPEQQVRAFVEAFNARDIDLMLAMADEKVQWLIVDGAKVSVETEGKAALRESMVRYFAVVPHASRRSSGFKEQGAA